MTDATLPARPRAGRPAWLRDAVAVGLPTLALAAMLAVILHIRPSAMSYFGFTLLFKLATPLVFAALSQMLVVMLGDIDLSNGSFVGLVTCVTALFLQPSPVVAMVIFALMIAAYAGFGLLIYLRQLPSIIVTLGMSFIWLGTAVILLPAPGGTAPAWLSGFMGWRPPILPLPIWIAIAAAVLGHMAITRSSFGAVLRGAGANPRAIERAGWSLVGIRAAVYAAAGVLALLSGLTLTGLTTSGDANVAPAYTLLGVGAVILGGGAFTGGVVSPVGTVVGALTLSLAGSLLSFLQVPPTWQIGAQGVILFGVLAGRILVTEKS
ncbi:ABC transporter permease [Lichenihabitans sp. Uapishka_5]|uniref:ABC transporter permease n=1 Tax=Lichenihabitans sp. Uapishka_5 TaxID=3037302 RepID=UPI0029E80733|nr:ABC transporter permease [Lichenihabitans sp. Uapishka_5]MDX7950849.1 ABC transporter permease [Lichenihabitans sp. Uapishka_5]